MKGKVEEGKEEDIFGGESLEGGQGLTNRQADLAAFFSIHSHFHFVAT